MEKFDNTKSLVASQRLFVLCQPPTALFKHPLLGFIQIQKVRFFLGFRVSARKTRQKSRFNSS